MDIKTPYFVKIIFFLALVMVEGIPLHYIEFPSKQWIRHKFSKDKYFKSH